MKFILLILLLILASCSQKTNTPSAAQIQEGSIAINSAKANSEQIQYNAVVGEIGTDCGNSRLIHLENKEGETQIFLPVNEINLPDSLRVTGLKVYIEYRDPMGDEYMSCTTLGPTYS